jgi:hypothetical protein
MTAFVTKSNHLIEEVRSARSAQALMQGVGGFIDQLKTAADPDEPPVSEQEARALQALADAAIDAIETRIDTAADSDKVQRQLAGAVYEIREMIERVDRWRRGRMARPA